MIFHHQNETCFICGKKIIGMYHVDHEIELTEFNYQDPSISLNPELLRVMHRKCHDKRHGRFGYEEKETTDESLNIDYSKRKGVIKWE